MEISQIRSGNSWKRIITLGEQQFPARSGHSAVYDNISN